MGTKFLEQVPGPVIKIKKYTIFTQIWVTLQKLKN